MAPQNRERKKKKGGGLKAVLAALAIIIVIAGGALWVVRFAPTGERMELTDYYRYTTPNEAALISDGEYLEPAEGEHPYALLRDGEVYIALSELKAYYDDGYVWDSTEGIVRYATAGSIITVSYSADPYSYTEGIEQRSWGVPLVLSEDGVSDTVYIDLDFVMQYTDMTLASVAPDLARVVIETPGYTKRVCALKRNASLRRFGGPKSLILADAERGAVVSVLEDYGKWSLVLTEDGIRGCVENSRLGDKSEVVTAATLPERVYSHLRMDGEIEMAWHQVTNQTANEYLGSVISQVQGLNVISPTWYYLNDNAGGIADLSSASYVELAHANGIAVWALVSNFENREVDTATVLNTTSSRDRLVESLVASVAAVGADGINVDFEQLPIASKDGFKAFIRELSIRCEEYGLYLSVDNYPPSEYTDFYDREMQANYADYVVLMGYDEYNGASVSAGPTASLPFVINAIESTLSEVPAEQFILGMPFFTRLWATTGGEVTSSASGMRESLSAVSEAGAETTWLETEQLNYAEWMNGDTRYQVWLEDGASLSKKLALIGQYNLAGGSFWKLGLEPAEIWDTVTMYIH